MSNRAKSHSSEMLSRSSSTDYEDEEEDHFSSFWAFNSLLGLLSAIGMALLIVFPYWVNFWHFQGFRACLGWNRFSRKLKLARRCASIQGFLDSVPHSYGITVAMRLLFIQRSFFDEVDSRTSTLFDYFSFFSLDQVSLYLSRKNEKRYF